MQIGGGEFQKNIRISAPNPGTKILVPQFSHMPDQFLGKNEKEPKFDPFLGSFPPKIYEHIKKNLFGQTSLVID